MLIEKTPAQRFVETYGEKIEAAIETMAGELYEKELEGAPAYCSQYGQPYETVEIRIDIGMGDEPAVTFILKAMERWINEHKGKAIVWRVRPTVQTLPRSFEDNTLTPTKVRMRFRAHSLEEIPVCLP